MNKELKLGNSTALSMRWATGVCLCLLLTGCFNQAESTVDLGSVSVGQQIIDLKKARDTNSISNGEYEESKAALLHLLKNAAEGEDFEHDSDEDDSDRGRDTANGKGKSKDKDDDDSGWLF